MKGYRTVIIAAAIAVVGALQGLHWADLLPANPSDEGWIVAGLAALMGALRALTTTPVGDNGK